MTYYLIIGGIAISSFLLAIYKENRFDKKIEELNKLENEIKDISIKLEKLNNPVKKRKIVFRTTYELMDYDAILSDVYEFQIESKKGLNLISNSFNYGQESFIIKHKNQQDVCTQVKNKKAKEYFFNPSHSHELIAS